MPLDVRGRTRATLNEPACVYPGSRRSGNPLNLIRARDCRLQLSDMNEEYLVGAASLTRVDYVPALCTHRPSLLPIGYFGEPPGSAPRRRPRGAAARR